MHRNHTFHLGTTALVLGFIAFGFFVLLNIPLKVEAQDLQTLYNNGAHDIAQDSRWCNLCMTQIQNYFTDIEGNPISSDKIGYGYQYPTFDDDDLDGQQDSIDFDQGTKCGLPLRPKSNASQASKEMFEDIINYMANGFTSSVYFFNETTQSDQSIDDKIYFLLTLEDNFMHGEDAQRLTRDFLANWCQSEVPNSSFQWNVGFNSYPMDVSNTGVSPLSNQPTSCQQATSAGQKLGCELCPYYDDTLPIMPGKCAINTYQNGQSQCWLDNVITSTIDITPFPLPAAGVVGAPPFTIGPQSPNCSVPCPGGICPGLTSEPAQPQTPLPSEGSPYDKLVNPLGTAGITSFPDFIEAALRVFVKVGIPLVTLAIIWSGFLFIWAQGKPEDLRKAKMTLLYTLIGAALILGAWVIANAIGGTIEGLVGSVLRATTWS